MIEEIKRIDSSARKLREFGAVMFVFFMILSAVFFLKRKEINFYFLAAGAFFLLAGMSAPRLLAPLYKAWMVFALVMGFIVSRIILTVLFFLVITPIGLIARIFGKDLLDERIRKTENTYWKMREDGPKPAESYENQY